MKIKILAHWNPGRHLLAVGLLALVSVPAHAASLLDRFKKDVEEEAGRLSRKFPKIEFPNSKIEVPNGSEPRVAAPTNWPTETRGASAAPSDLPETVTTSTPPAGLSLPPAANASNPPHDANTPAQALQKYPTSGVASVPASLPRVTVVPLTDIQAIYETIQDDPTGRESFAVSSDGRHCASFKRLGLTSWTVQIDGRLGPELKGVAPSGFGDLGRKVFPTEDFSRVFYLGLDAKSEPVLVIQGHHGGSQVYPARAGNHAEAWQAEAKESLANRRLIRSRRYEAPKLGTCYEVQVDENGPVLGPFAAPGQLNFEASHQHYLLAGLLPTWIRENFIAKQQAFYRDGSRVCQEFLPEAKYGRTGVVGASGITSARGTYFVQIPTGNDGSRYILNGTNVVEHPRALGIFSQPTFSPDGAQLAAIGSVGQGSTIYLNGHAAHSQPAGVPIERLQFTHDSGGLVYSVGSPPRVAVFTDDREAFQVVNGVLVDLRAGPHRGQFSCFVKTRDRAGALELVVNGRRQDFGSTVAGRQVNYPVPSNLWFTPDGEHVFGYWRDNQGEITFFEDSVVVKATLSGQPFVTGRLGEPVLVGDSRLCLVGMNQAVGPAGGNTTMFFRIEAERTGRTLVESGSGR